MNFNNYTQKSLEAVQGARDLAVQNNHQQMEQVHLLLALLRQDGGLIPQLRCFGVLAEMEKSICLRKCSRWWRRTGSNRGPPACEAGALTS